MTSALQCDRCKEITTETVEYERWCIAMNDGSHHPPEVNADFCKHCARYIRRAMSPESVIRYEGES